MVIFLARKAHFFMISNIQYYCTVLYSSWWLSIHTNAIVHLFVFVVYKKYFFYVNETIILVCLFIQVVKYSAAVKWE